MATRDEHLNILIECRDMPQSAEGVIIKYEFVKESVKVDPKYKTVRTQYEKVIDIAGIKHKCIIIEVGDIYDIWIGNFESPHRNMKIATRYEPKNITETEFLLTGSYRLRPFMTKKKSLKIK